MHENKHNCLKSNGSNEDRNWSEGITVKDPVHYHLLIISSYNIKMSTFSSHPFENEALILVKSTHKAYL